MQQRRKEETFNSDRNVLHDLFRRANDVLGHLFRCHNHVNSPTSGACNGIRDDTVVSVDHPVPVGIEEGEIQGVSPTTPEATRLGGVVFGFRTLQRGVFTCVGALRDSLVDGLNPIVASLF